jgi:RHS repeat-associated protein
MKAHQRQILRHAFSLSLSLFALLSWNVMIGSGQENGPKRGFQPGGSFALSDIESINTTNGNLMMHFPLASLPAGRGGLTAGINLIYSSKLYNSRTEWLRDYGKSCTIGEFGSQQICPYYQRTNLEQTPDGGWRYALAYTLEVIDRTMEGSMDPNMQCSVNGYVSDGYLPMTYRFKLKIHFPDGSVHEMRPSGYSDLNSQDALGDYYNIRPDGWIEDCFQGGHMSSTPTISYYSTDGTYARLDVQHDADDMWWNNPWTLYLPDGTRVTGGNAPERIHDRNNNYVEVDNIANYQGTNNGAVQLVDQLNRAVTLVYNGAGYGEDTITSQGFGDTLVWKVRWKTIGVDKSYWPCPESMTPCQIHDTGLPQGPDTLLQNLGVVDRLTLPVQAGNLTYTFNYNAPDRTGGDFQPSIGWGELSGVTLPSGAHAAYQYNFDNDSTAEYTPDVMKDFPTAKQLVYRPEYDGATVSNTPCNPQTETCITENWSYSTADNGGGGTVTSPDGGVSTDYAIATNYSVSWQYWNVGLVYASVHPDGSKTERIWAKNKLGDYGTYEWMRGDNPYVKTEFTSIKNAAGTYVKTAIKDYNYDKNGNVTRVAEYDWVDYASVPRDSNGNPTGPPSVQPSRITTNNYYASTPDASQSPVGGNIYWFQSSPLLKNAMASSELSDGSGSVLSRTELSYDDPLTTGNLTQKKSWDSTKGPYSSSLTTGNSISVSMQYNQYGSPTQTTDARGTQTLLTYGNVGGVSDLYPTQIQTAFGTSVQRTETRVYDFGTGLVTSATDTDNNVTTSTGHDVFGRPTLVKAADGIQGVETDTVTIYSDVDRRVIVKSDLNTTGDGKLVSIQHYDQLGRIRLTRQLEDATNPNDAYDETIGIKVQTRYLFSGSNSYVLSSNPYRAAYSSSASGEGTMGWTRSKSDNSGRMIEVQTFGGGSLPAPWGSNATSTGTVNTAYDANFTTVTDQAGKLRRSMTNGLGQLVRVDEPDGNGNLDVSGSPAQPTSYDYDVLGNLLHVYQASQTRTFTYSSLARLLTAANPESGTLSYQYDNNGNLTQKTDARSVISTYVYDLLNRNTSVTYSNDPANTPTVTRTYDNSTSGAYGIGKIWKTQTSGSSGTFVTIDSYDPLGRPKNQRQQFYYNNAWSQSYSISNITFDSAGHLLSETYPSGRVATNSFDNAGRLSSFTGNLGDGTNRNYATGIIYDAGSRMTKEQFGTSTPIFNKLFYNSRGQLSEIRESTSYTGPTDTSWNRGAILNQYSTQCSGPSCNGTDNNGNLRKQEHWIPDANGNVSAIPTQQYDYDSLNRLQRVYEGTTWQQQYGYDRWGNRTINNNSNATWGDGINNVVATIDTSSNRMLATNDPNHTLIDYDPAGNQTKDYLTSNGTRSYDAENRMVQAVNTSNQISAYTYDGDGKRVRRNIAGVETWQVYGLGGELIAEYAQNGSASSPQKEYGYRNGQLLITATVTTGWGSAPTLNDNPLSVGQTTVQARHITELREAINALRSHLGLSAYSWQYSATTNDYIGADPILEMRTALDQALGAPSGGYSPGLAQNQLVKAIHIQELRDRVLAAWQSGSGVDIRWQVSDQLGTPRMIFDQSGSLANVSRHDYLPFGEELFAGTGGRTAAQGYSASDGVRQHFTQKERDIETGLDYFLARYYSSMQGRFTSPDEFSGGPDELYEFEESSSNNPTFYADPADPQSFNKYQYAYNNPLRYVDPDGHQGRETVSRIIKTGVEFGGGVMQGAVSSATFGLFGAPSPTDSRTNRIGQVVGTLAEGVAGLTVAGPVSGGETLGSGGVSVLTGTTQLTVAIGATMTAGSVGNLIRLATTPIQRNSTSDDRAGKPFTKKGKETVVEENKGQNGGQTKCSNCGTETVPGQQSSKGVRKPSNETQVDHIRPKSRGGQGRPDNGQVLCRKCNQAKGNKVPEQE